MYHNLRQTHRIWSNAAPGAAALVVDLRWTGTIFATITQRLVHHSLRSNPLQRYAAARSITAVDGATRKYMRRRLRQPPRPRSNTHRAMPSRLIICKAAGGQANECT